MRYSELFGKTRRDAPAEITDPARRLAYRAGLLRPGSHGPIYLPLACRVIDKLRARLIALLETKGVQQIGVAVAAELTDLAAQEIQSYKQLPARLAWREYGGTEVRIAALEPDGQSAKEAADLIAAVAVLLFEWAGVEARVAQGEDDRRMWFAPAEGGDLELLRCSHGDYEAVRGAARRYVPQADSPEPLLALEPVATPHCETIDSLAALLNVPTARTAKAVFYASDGKLIFAVIRGDLQIDEGKLRRAIESDSLRAATEDEIRRVGAVPGYASPIGVRGATVIVDESVAASPNLVAGANREGYHLLNTNVPRDYQPDLIADIALARPGDPCPNGDGVLEAERGILLGSCSKPEELHASYLDTAGRTRNVWGARAGIDLGRTLLAFVAGHHDEKGIIWTRELAPYAVHITALNADRPEVAAAVAQATAALDAAGIDYLLDDRTESAGVKFNDADLIGLPTRLTIGPRTVAQHGVEVKRRDEPQSRLVPLAQLNSEL